MRNPGKKRNLQGRTQIGSNWRERQMTTKVDQHRGPHIEIQKLLHQAAREGAARATVEIWAGRLDYRDDRPFRTTIDTGNVDPDYIYTVDRAIEKHTAPDGLHVHVMNHNNWGA